MEGDREKADISVIRSHPQSNVFQLRMNTEAAVNWMVSSLSYEGWQMMGARTLCVDQHYVLDIVKLAEEAGLSVE
jgi:hypothetical protein